jgi:hypothetical protein
MFSHMKKILLACTAVCFSGTFAYAQNVALLLFDAKRSEEFAGCLNCNRYDSGSVCNAYGDYGSKYSDTSIWNRYGKFGSKYEENSPWNRYSDGLIVVDREGNFYGHFSLNKHARYGQSNLGMVRSLLQLYEMDYDLDDIRDLLCDD